MNYAFTNGKLLDGNRDMQVQTGLCILVKDGVISDIVPDTADVTGYQRVDLHGYYILPGLINMHVHLTGSIEKGKAADLIVTAENPLEDLRALRNLELVVARGNVIEHPVIKKRKQVEAELDKFL
mgnify:FL=1